ncbi:MAG TPA: amidohydrolase family protein, partial [Thermoanaerobaculia bacterium]|nr:amidohydrolase family protein [Thermoanaerobaculia bacterium]
MSARHNALALAALLGLAAAALPVGAETVAITGATIHTLGPQGTIRNGTIVVADGKIQAVGAGVAVPSGARRIDAQGKVVTPGLFDAYSRFGLSEIPADEGSQDASLNGDRMTAAFQVVDAINPRTTTIPVNRVNGLTRAVVAPSNGSNSLIAGQGAIIHLGIPAAGSGDIVVRTPVAMFATLGEAGAQRAGGSRGGAILRLREALEDAKDFAANRASYDKGERRDYALSRLDLEAMIPVVRGELPLVLTAQRASDIEAALRLAKDYKLKLILQGVAEGWEVADQIAAAKVPVIVNVLNNLPESLEETGATLENAARLQKAGVTVMIGSGGAHLAYGIRQQAGNAVSYGLPWEEGLAAVTRTPARVWGLGDRLGTLEAGKEADLVVWDGDPLEVTTFPVNVFIRGAEMPMDSRQLQLRDRYKNLG